MEVVFSCKVHQTQVSYKSHDWSVAYIYSKTTHWYFMSMSEIERAKYRCNMNKQSSMIFYFEFGNCKNNVYKSCITCKESKELSAC